MVMASLFEDYDISQSAFILRIRQLIKRILTNVVRSTGLDKKEICRRICQLPSSSRLTPRILHDLDNAVTKSEEHVDITMLSTLIRYVIIPSRSSTANIDLDNFNMYDDVCHLRRIRNKLLHNNILPMYLCVDVINDLRRLAKRFENYLDDLSYVDCVNDIYMKFLDPMNRKYAIYKALESRFKCYQIMGVRKAKSLHQKRTWNDDDLPAAYHLQEKKVSSACQSITTDLHEENQCNSFESRKEHNTKEDINQVHVDRSSFYSNKNCKDIQQHFDGFHESLERREEQIRMNKKSFSIEKLSLRPLIQDSPAVSTYCMHEPEMKHKEFKSIDKTMTQCNTVWHKTGSRRNKVGPVGEKILTRPYDSIKESNFDIIIIPPENIGCAEDVEQLQSLQKEVCGLQSSSSRDLVMPGHSIFDHLSEINSLFIVLMLLGKKNIGIPTLLMYEIKILLKLHKTSRCTILLLTQPKTDLRGYPMTIYRQNQKHNTQYDVVFWYHADDFQIAKQNKNIVDKILRQGFRYVKSELYRCNILPGKSVLTSFANAYEMSNISLVILTENFCSSHLEINKVVMAILKAFQSDIKVNDNLVLIVGRCVKIPNALLPLEQFEENDLQREDPILCARLIDLFKKNGFQPDLPAE